MEALRCSKASAGEAPNLPPQRGFLSSLSMGWSLAEEGVLADTTMLIKCEDVRGSGLHMKYVIGALAATEVYFALPIRQVTWACSCTKVSFGTPSRWSKRARSRH